LNPKKCRALYEEIKSKKRNIPFRDICCLCECAGMYMSRQKGSHQIYLHTKNRRIFVNLQDDKGMAKFTQVQQVLDLIEEHGLL
jgi:predicted RNA binding protein YcfA (HicA-like mRNA interferase family)